MHRIRRILVAVKDPTQRSQPALAKAAQIAAGCDAELVLFQAISAPVSVDADVPRFKDGLAGIERSTRDKSLGQLERIAQRLRRTPLKVSVSAEWDFPVYDAIVREAYRVDADLVVAEQHAGSHRAAGLLRLTDWELLRHSPMPVLLVKRAGRYRRPNVLAAVDPTHSYRKPAGLDLELLHIAAAVAGALGGHLHAVHAYEAIPLTAFSAGTLSALEVERRAAQSARAAAEELRRVTRPLHVPESRRHVIARHPSDSIVQVANDTHSAVVVMGALSRSGLKRLLIGDTTEKVLDRLSCDVLVIKPAGVVRRPPHARRGVRYRASLVHPWID